MAWDDNADKAGEPVKAGDLTITLVQPMLKNGSLGTVRAVVMWKGVDATNVPSGPLREEDLVKHASAQLRQIGQNLVAGTRAEIDATYVQQP